MAFVKKIYEESYVTYDEVMKSQIGFDFSQFTKEQIMMATILGSQIIEDYTNRVFGPGEFTEKTEGTTDHQDRIFVVFNNRPVNSVKSLKVIYVGSVDVNIDLKDFDLFPDEGYGYYYYNLSIYRGQRWLPETFVYEVEYDVIKPVPTLVKQACIMLAGNVLRDQYLLNEKGKSIADNDIQSFKSGEYSETYRPIKDSIGGGEYTSTNNKILTPEVKMFLSHYVSLNQNLY